SNTSDGEKYLVSIKNTDRSFNQMSLHMWVDILPGTFGSWQSSTTFRVEILLSAECPPNTDKDVCATAASDCLEISGSTYSSDEKVCKRACEAGEELVGLGCQLCPVGTYSKQHETCQPCEPGTISFEPGDPFIWLTRVLLRLVPAAAFVF
ncbi:hypothetical protein CYMTET_33533, partial [Cymbomonas tetramitiformis]